MCTPQAKIETNEKNVKVHLNAFRVEISNFKTFAHELKDSIFSQNQGKFMSLGVKSRMDHQGYFLIVYIDLVR